MSSNKQSSIEWLMPNILGLTLELSNNRISQRTSELKILELFEQAKEMERELIKESCIMAIMQWNEWDKTNYLDLYDHKVEGAEIWAEDYCKELYEEIEVPNPNFNNMKTKEKAEELIRKYTIATWIKLDEIKFLTKIPTAHECALIAVDEILNDDWYIATREDLIARKEYWNKVKQEIEKL